MKLRPLLFLFCLCHLGLTEEPTPVAPDASDPVDKEEETDDLVQSCSGGQVFSREEHQAIGGAIERLGLQLLQNLPIGPQQPNVILSPLSVAFALAQLTLGARNETERLLLKTLHAHNLPCYHHILGSLVPHFSKTSLDVATRMYLRPEVNQWVENVTNGHIPNFLESIPHDVVLMLMNAVYFKVTSKGAFYLDGQNSVLVDMMRSAHHPLRLLDDPELDAQVASFPFKGNTSFLIVLPLPGRVNVSSLLPKLNISDLYRRLPQEKTIQVNLPKVKLQYRQELQEALSSMGLSSLFTGPNLSGISDHPLRVTSVRHASTVELSEEGVEASATTVVTSMRSVSLFSVNSPFVFALVDDASLTPLFMGVVTNPAPDNNPMLNDDPHGNSTMSDQPVMDSTRDINSEQIRKTESEEGGSSSVRACSASSGEKEQPCSVNELEGNRQKKTQEEKPSSIPDHSVPV
ncbi:hypothetical protein INR49_030024 [Caranx melampygus]|nr:hypothetical protein INR49_030024 [Caranx melampygus]